MNPQKEVDKIFRECTLEETVYIWNKLTEKIIDLTEKLKKSNRWMKKKQR